MNISSSLSSMRKNLQDFAETLGAALDIDIALFDRQRCIAGTGGCPPPQGGLPPAALEALIRRVRERGIKKFVFALPGTDILCRGCGVPCRPEAGCLRPGAYAVLGAGASFAGLIGLSGKDGSVFGTEQELVTMLGLAGWLGQLLTAFIQWRPFRHACGGALGLAGPVSELLERGVLLLDRNDRIVDANAFLLRLLERQKEDVLDLPVTCLWPSFAADTRGKRRGRAGTAFPATGRNRAWRCLLEPVREDGKNMGTICVVEPVTEGAQPPFPPRGPADPGGGTRLADIVGRNADFLAFKEKVRNVAAHDSTVLFVGETGTGKELFARALHFEGRRRQSSFVAVDCAAIPDTLFESELFGYEKGAFTGADARGRPGKFCMADGGTLFFDELEVLPFPMQAKLLRVLEQREIERVGGDRPIPVDVRIVAASNAPLEELVRRGAFREDLFYRFNVVTLCIPPLRERGNDALVLARHFIRIYARKFRKDVRGLSNKAMKMFRRYNWPGNVRELQNAIEYAVNMEQNRLIAPESLPVRLARPAEAICSSAAAEERERILHALARFGSSAEGKIRAARSLGVSRATLYRKLRRLGLHG